MPGAWGAHAGINPGLFHPGTHRHVRTVHVASAVIAPGPHRAHRAMPAGTGWPPGGDSGASLNQWPAGGPRRRNAGHQPRRHPGRTILARQLGEP